MIKFLQDAIKELQHVVWPTQKETKKYFMIVVSMIVVCTIVLFAFGSSMTNALFSIRSVVTPPRPVVDTPVSDDVLKKLKTLTGSTDQTKNTVSGSATPVAAPGAAVSVTPNK